jgi:ABC-type Fe2+-enterobactin transport system substrate-binding protein
MFTRIRRAWRTFRFEKRLEATKAHYDLKITAAATADEALDHRRKRNEMLFALVADYTGSSFQANQITVGQSNCEEHKA